MTFANQLRTLRDAKGLSREALADKAGISRQSVALLEDGDRNPSLETAEKLAKALGKKLRVFET